MADDVTKKPAATADESPATNAETTLTKDGDLSINQAQPTNDQVKSPDVSPAPKEPVPSALAEAKPSVDENMVISKPAEPTPVESKPANADQSAPLIPAPSAISTPTIAATEKPAGNQTVVISKQEAEAADGLESDSAGQNPEQELGEQVETLTGEIQALESKIERLSGTGAAPETKSDAKMADPISKPSVSLPVSTTPTMAPPTNPDTVLPPLPETPTSMSDDRKAETLLPGEVAAKKEEAKPATAAKPEDKSAVATFNDIFAKSDKEKPDKKVSDSSTASTTPISLMPGSSKPVADGSAVATIGEVLAFFGILMLAVVLVGPFYKTMISDSLYTMIKSIGWMVAPVSLLISFIVLMFAKGKGLFKVAVFVLLLISVVFYLGVNTNGTISNQLNSVLGSVLGAYK